MTALLLVPLLIWAGLFAFIWYVDGRVRALERRLNERKDSRLR